LAQEACQSWDLQSEEKGQVIVVVADWGLILESPHSEYAPLAPSYALIEFLNLLSGRMNASFALFPAKLFCVTVTSGFTSKT
jgi:hypothetical protein